MHARKWHTIYFKGRIIRGCVKRMAVFFADGYFKRIWWRSLPFFLLIHLGEGQIIPMISVRYLSVIFHSNLKMDKQITKACENTYNHPHNIWRIKKFLSQEATCTIIHAFITSQTDYCYSLMTGLPDNFIKKPQRVHNTFARLVLIWENMII